MESRRLPALFAIVGVIVAVVLFLVLKDDTADDEATTVPDAQQQVQPGAQEPAAEAGTEVPLIRVEDGQPVRGVVEIEVTKGEDIRFVVSSDVDEEVHLHGYDVAKEVSAGGSVEFDVPATIEGVFEVELEHAVAAIAEVSVVPG